MIAVRPPGPLGILGGTFDPIHLGHLRLGEEAIQQLSIAQVRFIPAGQPPLRDTPGASAEQRLAMVKLATSGNPHFEVDDSEVWATQRSYTVDTLEHLRDEVGPLRSLVLLLGNDAFERLEQWHRWQRIFALAHLAVATRPGNPVVPASPVGAQEQCRPGTAAPVHRHNAMLGETPAPLPLSGITSDTPLECDSALAHEVRQRHGTAADLAASPYGRIVPFTIPALDISATAIRRLLKAGQQPRYMVADAVVSYIDLHHLYR